MTYRLIKLLSVLAATGAVSGCIGDVSIVGEGDVTSASGSNNCLLEQHQANNSECARVVTSGISDTFTAEPKPGWSFDRWIGCPSGNDYNPQCAVSFGGLPPASVSPLINSGILPVYTGFAAKFIQEEPITRFSYPLQLVPGDARLDFPAAEGRQADFHSDSWFVEGILEGQNTGKRYSFIAIFYLARINGTLPFDFYSIAIYDLDKPDYGTYTSYQTLQANSGSLDLSIPANGKNATWTTSRDTAGNLVPFTYKASLPGKDQKGRIMNLVLDMVGQTNPPVAVGADVYNGKIMVHLQPDTYSYFQTGLEFNGKLTWGNVTEAVTGKIGHMDRQMFPLYTGVNGTSADGRDFSHHWRTFFFDNGVDLSSWVMFDRREKNLVSSYNGGTTYDSNTDVSQYVGDLEYENLSYVRMKDHPVKPLVSGRAPVLYFVDKHRMTSASMNMDILVEPIQKNTIPMLSFPIEYVHGPVNLSGTMAGLPVHGIGSFERTHALYRDFELAIVLSDSVKSLPLEATSPAGAGVANILATVAQVSALIDSRDFVAASALANSTLKTQLQGLTEPSRSQMLQILNDMVTVIGVHGSRPGVPE